MTNLSFLPINLVLKLNSQSVPKMKLPPMTHPLRAVLPTRNPSLSPSTCDTVTLVDTPPTYDSVVPRLHRAPRKHGTLNSYKLGPIVYPARTVVTLLALITSLALIGSTAQALRDYSSATNVAASVPESIDFDLRATKLTLACGAYIAVDSLGFLITALALWVSHVLPDKPVSACSNKSCPSDPTSVNTLQTATAFSTPPSSPSSPSPPSSSPSSPSPTTSPPLPLPAPPLSAPPPQL